MTLFIEDREMQFQIPESSGYEYSIPANASPQIFEDLLQ